MGQKNQKHSHKKLKRWIVAVLEIAVVIAAVIGVMQWHHLGPFQVKEETAATPKPTPSAVTYVNDSNEPSGEYVLDDATVQSLRDEIAQDKAINPDIKGVLYFESGLIHKAVVQGTDNSYYIYHQWEDGSEGSTRNAGMLDYRNDLSRDDMNTIMYAHYWRRDDPAPYDNYGFTALRKLRDQSEYEANKYVVFVTETDIRYYVVAYAYSCPIVHASDGDYPAEGMEYNRVSYDNQYFASYIQKVKENEYYDTGVSIDYGDKFLTLQTCLQETDDAHEVILCKELGRKSF